MSLCRERHAGPTLLHRADRSNGIHEENGWRGWFESKGLSPTLRGSLSTTAVTTWPVTCGERLAIMDTFERRRWRKAIPRYRIGKTGKGLRARALASYGDGLFAFRLGEIGESRKRNETALKIAEQIRDPEAETLSHLGLSKAY